jgi:RNA polymerase sigma-70 factor (ECF subfamily)
MDEHDLVERAKEGDMAAYGSLVRGHQRVAQHVAFLITGSSAAAEDAAQAAFVKAWYALGRFRSGSAFRPWLLKIVANEARNQRRSAGRRAALVDVLGAQPASTSISDSPERLAVSDERRRALLAGLDRLADNDRLIIGYRYFLELSEAATAEALGCAKGTVKSRLSRALERLRAVLADDQLLEVGP